MKYKILLSAITAIMFIGCGGGGGNNTSSWDGELNTNGIPAVDGKYNMREEITKVSCSIQELENKLKSMVGTVTYLPTDVNTDNNSFYFGYVLNPPGSTIKSNSCTIDTQAKMICSVVSEDDDAGYNMLLEGYFTTTSFKSTKYSIRIVNKSNLESCNIDGTLAGPKIINPASPLRRSDNENAMEQIGYYMKLN